MKRTWKAVAATLVMAFGLSAAAVAEDHDGFRRDRDDRATWQDRDHDRDRDRLREFDRDRARADWYRDHGYVYRDGGWYRGPVAYRNGRPIYQYERR